MVGGASEDPELEVRLVVHASAEADILEACRWYESKGDGLGNEFINEVDAAFERATKTPESYPIAYRGLRRLVLKRFPYVAYFSQEQDVVQVSQSNQRALSA